MSFQLPDLISLPKGFDCCGQGAVPELSVVLRMASYPREIEKTPERLFDLGEKQSGTPKVDTVGPAFAFARTLLSSEGQRLLHIITRAKNNIVAREERPQAYGGRGRPCKYGKRIKLDELFTTRADDFSTVTGSIYGENKKLEVLCLDLVWQANQEKLRMVLVKEDTSTFILICSDLSISPQEIVELYACRYKIEVTFKMVKHIIGGLYYHFWFKAWQDNVAKALTVTGLELGMTKARD